MRPRLREPVPAASPGAHVEMLERLSRRIRRAEIAARFPSSALAIDVGVNCAVYALTH
jgi:hypothetical protein